LFKRSNLKDDLVGDLEIQIKYLGKWLFKVKAVEVKQEHLEHEIDRICIELQAIIQELRKGNMQDLIDSGRLDSVFDY